jgi:UDP-2,3-diacylglucosamine hydrolase
MTTHTLFISDLHLQATEPYIVTLFAQFLKEHATQAEALYILGDLFEVWPGDDEDSEFSQNIRGLLKDCVNSGTPVYILPGNRDFLLGPRFAKDTGCTILRDPTVIQLYGQSILLLHGDTLCTHDRLHQYYRRIIQNPTFNRIATHILPLSVRHKIGQFLRKLSKRHTKRQRPIYMDVINESVAQQFQQSGAPMMIHGHTHRPMIETTYLNQRPSIRYVLGSWHEKGNALSVGADTTINFLMIS